MIRVFFRFFQYLKSFREIIGAKVYLVFILSSLIGFVDSVGIVMFFPVLEGIDNIQKDIPDNYILHQIKSLLAFLNISESVATVLILIIFIFIFKFLLSFLSAWMVADLRAKLLMQLKSKLLTAFSKMQYLYYSEKSSGYFVNLFNEQVTSASGAFVNLIQLFTQLVYATIYVIFAFIVSWQLAIAALFIGVIVFILMLRLNIFAQKLSKKSAYESGFIAKNIIQVIQGYKYFLASGNLNKFNMVIRNSIDRLSNWHYKILTTGGFVSTIREPIAVISIASIIYIHIAFLGYKISVVLISIILFYRTLNSILAIQLRSHLVMESIVGLELIIEELETLSLNEYEETKNLEDSNFFFKSEIELRDVSFFYSSNNIGVSNLNFRIPKNSSLAIVGPSGSGKSTIIDLLTLILEPKKGNIYIDGVCTNEINGNKWREKIGFVSQDCVIVDDTIANNIALFSKKENKRIMDAAVKANIFSFINSLPDKFETKVGERGVKLSGGQRQRLFISRELYKEPEILILDEATSSLDSESEKNIQSTIDALLGKVTVIIVAHRLSTIKDVDNIIYIDNGEIIDIGNFNYLSKNSKKFKRLIKDQFINNED